MKFYTFQRRNYGNGLLSERKFSPITSSGSTKNDYRQFFRSASLEMPKDFWKYHLNMREWKMESMKNSTVRRKTENKHTGFCPGECTLRKREHCILLCALYLLPSISPRVVSDRRDAYFAVFCGTGRVLAVAQHNEKSASVKWDES